MSRSKKQWRLDKFCPGDCLGLVPTDDGRRICTWTRMSRAVLEAGFAIEDVAIQDVFVAAGGKPTSIQPRFTPNALMYIPKWVFPIVVSHFRVEVLLDGNSYHTGISIQPGMAKNEDAVQDVKSCIENVNYRLAKLALLGHDTNETIRRLALEVLKDGHEDPVVPDVPGLRKNWVCLRRMHKGAPNGADWLKAVQRTERELRKGHGFGSSASVGPRRPRFQRTVVRVRGKQAPDS